MQLLLRQERKFSWEQLVTAALEAEANKGLNTMLPDTPRQFVKTMSDDFVDNMISSRVEHNHFDATIAAEQAIGDFAGNYAHDEIIKPIMTLKIKWNKNYIHLGSGSEANSRD